MDEEVIRQAAKWIYRNKDTPDWWTPLVVSEVNTDQSCPKLTVQNSFRVFQALKEKELMVEAGELQTQNGNLPKYAFNFGKLEEWNEYISLGWYERKVPAWLRNLISKWRGFLLACLLLILTSFFQAVFKEAGSDFYDWFRPEVEKKIEAGDGEPDAE